MKRIFSLIIFCFILQGCNITRQDLTPSFLLSNGMSKAEVIELLGIPIRIEISDGIDEWFYCSTGLEIDEHLALFFYDEKLIASCNYTVSLRDVNGLTGSCEYFIKLGSYRIPEVVYKLRN